MLWPPFLTASLQVVLAGLLLGPLKQYPSALALLLALALVWSFRRKHGKGVDLRLLGLGTALTLAAGTGAELWGTHGGHWTYHGLPPGRFLPEWVPLAWALAYHLLYGVGTRLAPLGRPRLMALLACAWLPWLGEAAAIASGVWTYHWPWQVAGVPALAILLLVVAHAGIHGVVRWVSTARGIPDPVYRPL